MLCSAPFSATGSGRHIRITRALIYREGRGAARGAAYRVAVLERTLTGDPALAQEAFHLQLGRAASGSGMPEAAFPGPEEADYAWQLACPPVCTGQGSLHGEGSVGERATA